MILTTKYVFGDKVPRPYGIEMLQARACHLKFGALGASVRASVLADACRLYLNDIVRHYFHVLQLHAPRTFEHGNIDQERYARLSRHLYDNFWADKDPGLPIGWLWSLDGFSDGLDDFRQSLLDYGQRGNPVDFKMEAALLSLQRVLDVMAFRKLLGSPLIYIRQYSSS